MREVWDDCALPYQTGVGEEDVGDGYDPSEDDGGYSRDDDGFGD